MDNRRCDCRSGRRLRLLRPVEAQESSDSASTSSEKKSAKKSKKKAAKKDVEKAAEEAVPESKPGRWIMHFATRTWS
jgi:hypothetical protein